MKNFSIATLASHTSLQILKGAKDEGFRTLAFCINKNEQFYRNFQFIDKLVTLGNYRELIGLEKKLANSFVIMIPHGSFVAYLGKDFNRQTKFKYFGNKKVLEIGSAKGFVVEAMRDLGIDAYGIDVSQYAHDCAREDIKPFLRVADARTALADYANNEFAFLFSRWTLICFTDEELASMITQMNRIYTHGHK